MREGKGLRVNDDVVAMNKKECGGRNDKCTICGLLVWVFDRLVLSSVENKKGLFREVFRHTHTHTHTHTYIYIYIPIYTISVYSQSSFKI
ncbi:hypothetical protein M431DRAFT_372509 [Trichoderma harzianum CBS 226.95]|uniref:Uncharacterized protein n=1 Tax=Trichoderma harzianum CBS 226.95 TaxID=983964 RepID=A0A2T4AGX2_TRIHA|nr:hypothetical protein M431DRAFT_372509 [Trichoderma harzianum CBS 226.95]PTB56307.1 hypothetical protein M431DRAFT_372509 [Trichoderma harzianum CBS 226.95]